MADVGFTTRNSLRHIFRSAFWAKLSDWASKKRGHSQFDDGQAMAGPTSTVYLRWAVALVCVRGLEQAGPRVDGNSENEWLESALIQWPSRWQLDLDTCWVIDRYQYLAH